MIVNFGAIWAIAVKDLRQFLRDRISLFFMLTLPMMQLVLLAQATASGANNMPIAVLDFDRSAESRAFSALLDASDSLAIRDYPATLEAGTRALEAGDIFGLVIIPQGMASAIYNPYETAQVQVIVDATNTLVARVVDGAAQQVTQRFIAQRGGAFAVGVQVDGVMLYNPGVRSRPYTLGAQLGFITYQQTLAIAALGLAREKEIGTLEQLMVTPVRRFELLLGKTIPPTIAGLAVFFALSLAVQYIFHIPIQGSYLFLLGGSLLFIVVEVIWGTMVSSLAGTQQQAILLVFVQAMMDVALSGYLVPVRDMPGLFRFFAQFVPLHYYLIFVRAVVLKGAGFADMWPQLATLAAIGVVMAAIATYTISRNLD